MSTFLITGGTGKLGSRLDETIEISGSAAVTSGDAVTIPSDYAGRPLRSEHKEPGEHLARLREANTAEASILVVSA